MKKFLSAVTICSLTLSSAFAATNSLESCSEFKKLNRVSSLQVQYHNESVGMYKELSENAGNTANLSLGLFTASSLALAGLAYSSATGFKIITGPLEKAVRGLVELFPAIEKSMVFTMVAAIGGFASPLTGTITAIGNGIYRLSNDELNLSVELTKNDLEKNLVEIDNLLSVVKKEREKVDLNYSKLQDMITLGGKSAKTTEKLYQLALTEHELLVSKQKIAEVLEKASCN